MQHPPHDAREANRDAMTNSNPSSAPSAPESESSLIRRIAAGDRSAFESMMRQYNRRLYRLARSAMRNETDAEDALQEAYLSAYRSIGEFRGDSSLSTWLTRLVLNECMGRLRRSARRQNVIPMVSSNTDIDVDNLPGNDTDPPDKAIGRAQMRALLERKLDELPESFRMVFVLRAVEEMTVEDTAQCLGLNEATVRSRHFRARGLLRESLARDIDLAERDLFDFGGAHCDRVVAGVMGRLEP
jgi:RNA polymerase sigma-70 factor (ECF subfamily)